MLGQKKKITNEKMKCAMKKQMNDLQRTDRSPLSDDHYQIEPIIR